MARDGQFVGSLTLSDRVREDAAHTVQQLQDRGYHTIMLTGVPACTAHREIPQLRLLCFTAGL